VRPELCHAQHHAFQWLGTRILNTLACTGKNHWDKEILENRGRAIGFSGTR